jgi:hypothetical protein
MSSAIDNDFGTIEVRHGKVMGRPKCRAFGVHIHKQKIMKYIDHLREEGIVVEEWLGQVLEEALKAELDKAVAQSKKDNR